VFVLTSRTLPRTRDTVEFYSGDLAQFVNGRLRPAFRNIWLSEGASSPANAFGSGWPTRCAIRSCRSDWDGIPFFEKLDRDVALHLAEVKGHRSGMVELCYEVRRPA
jgi:hypothetical protein